MGKDLHYTIIPFFEKALTGHDKVNSFELIPDNDFFIYKIKRNNGLSDLYVVLSDDYYFGDYSVISKHPILKNGGYILVAKPEAAVTGSNVPFEKLGVGKIGKFLGALNREDYWNYTIPQKSKK